MRLLVQRVKYSNILINNSIERKMTEGILVYFGVSVDDENIDEKTIKKAVNKLINLRFFENEEGKLKKNIKDVKGSIMLVSNFSLYAYSKKGTTLSFDKAANHILANKVYNDFLFELKKEYENIITGEFRADMQINSNAYGPVNVILDF